MTLTKERIADIISQRHGYSRRQSMKLLERLVEIIKLNLENGEDVLVSGFGKFCVKEKRSRRGRNPATGEDLMLKPRRIVTFKCSGKLKNALNSSAWS